MGCASIVAGCELFHQGTFVVAELGRNLHHDMRHKVATVTVAVHMRDAEILQGHGILRLASGRNADGLRSVERVDFKVMRAVSRDFETAQLMGT